MTRASGACPRRLLSGDLIRCPAIQLGVWAHRIVVFPPVSQNLAGMAERREQRLVEAFIPQPAVETFDKAVLLRFPGDDIVHSTFISSAHFRMAWDVNSVPLSLTIMRGLPYRSTRAVSSRATRPPDNDVSATNARFLRLKSSVTVRMRNRRPQIRASDIKSRLQRCPGSCVEWSWERACPVPSCGHPNGGFSDLLPGRGGTASCDWG